jgi:uncharacterized protein YhfF
MTIDQFWTLFCEQTKRDPSTKYLSVFHFELTEKWADELLQLVLSGKKRATASSLWSFELEGMEIPRAGDLSIVTDWAGNPRCVIETTTVTILPFDEMTFDICQREGEDDCLESWVDGHRRFFSNEGALMGYSFSETMPIVFEEFEVIYQM